MAKRLKPQPYEWIDRESPVGFEFEGDAYRGFSGDVISSALISARLLSDIIFLVESDATRILRKSGKLLHESSVTPIDCKPP